MFERTNSKYIFFGLILGIIIILLLFLVFRDSSSLPEEDSLKIEDVLSSGNVTNCNFIGNESQRTQCNIILGECAQGDDQCFYGKALHERFVQGCYLIENKELSSKCYIQTRDKEILYRAQDNKDTSICEEHTIQSKIVYCRDNVFYYLAKLEANNELCNNIENEGLRNECLL